VQTYIISIWKIRFAKKQMLYIYLCIY